MAFIENELEKKNLSDLSALILGYEQKIVELAKKIRLGDAKPTEMMTLNSDLAMLKKVRDKKMNAQSKIVPHAQPKAAAPLKSYEDYVDSHHKK